MALLSVWSAVSKNRQLSHDTQLCVSSLMTQCTVPGRDRLQLTTPLTSQWPCSGTGPLRAPRGVRSTYDEPLGGGGRVHGVRRRDPVAYLSAPTGVVTAHRHCAALAAMV